MTVNSLPPSPLPPASRAPRIHEPYDIGYKFEPEVFLSTLEALLGNRPSNTTKPTEDEVIHVQKFLYGTPRGWDTDHSRKLVHILYQHFFMGGESISASLRTLPNMYLNLVQHLMLTFLPGIAGHHTWNGLGEALTRFMLTNPVED